ncbi:Nucleoside-triphosphatase THEP1 [Gossypium australe]|uniref:Nucleoside-triphosphatase THEP1 n=1 Tax=Gossypium australe TaxID=47621 RepID=A0A5B6VNY5_9ROSI|nr:Nucleoside-triphosphatase THEP1 [Gossypium australe]
MISTAWRLYWGRARESSLDRRNPPNVVVLNIKDNAAICTWSEKLQLEKGDSLAKGYLSELWDFTRVSVLQNELQELRDIWAHWDEGTKHWFYQKYGNIPYLLDVKVDKHLFRAMTQFWNPAYNCFTFGKVDLVPTIEEYMTLLRCPRILVDKAYSKAANAPTFVKKLMSITGMSEPWVTAQIQQKGDGKCIPWVILRDLILAHSDAKNKADIFTLSIYGLVIFPKALRHIDEAVTDLFDRLDKKITPILELVSKSRRRKIYWMCATITGMVSRTFLEGGQDLLPGFLRRLFPLKEEVARQRRIDISEEKWMAILQNLKEEDVKWRAFWMVPNEILYRCGNFDYVPLPRIWGVTGYTSLLALRQFIPVTYGLAQSEFSYKVDNYKKRVWEVYDTWKQTRLMKRLAVGAMATPEYNDWINDNIPGLSLEGARSIEECLQVVASEIEVIRQDSEKKSLEFERRIEQLEEEKMHLRLDVEVQKAKAEKFRKGKTRVEENVDSLKTNYKKMRLSIRITGLGKTLEQWRQEVQGKRTKADQWEEKF